MAAQSKKKEEESKKETTRPKPVVEEVDEKEEVSESEDTQKSITETTKEEVKVPLSDPKKEMSTVSGEDVKVSTPASGKPSTAEETVTPVEATSEPVAEPEETKDEHVPISGGKEDEPEGEIEEAASKKGNFKIIFFTALVTSIIVASLAGGVYVYLTGTSAISKVGKTAEEETVVAEATTTPAPTATAEPAEELDLTQYSVSVLNGSGTAGAAGAAKTLLEAAGFEVGTTGNADTFDFTDTVVQVKEEVPTAAVDAAVAALEDNYSVETGDALEPSASDDIIVNVGTK